MQPSRHAVLTLLAEHGAGSSADVASALGWSRRRASMALLRAHRIGLACRRRGVYSLSGKGVARLEWLRGPR